jgi:hypothetical protein
MRVLVLRLAVLATALVTVLCAAAPAQARFIPAPGRSGGSDVDAVPAVVLGSVPGSGETFGGLEAPHTFNPLHGYPALGYDTGGFTTVPAGFGGVILGTTLAGASVSLYCVDHNTDTSPGIGYDPGAWNLAQVPHLGYVLRILQSYYPATGQPAAAPTNNRRAAAVQAAIWFFTDRFVLASGDARFTLTAQIVDAALAAGAVAEPHASLSITGPTIAAPGAVAGPFLVHGAVASATLHVTHGALFADARAGHPLPNGAGYPVGTPFWLRAPDPASARITATATVHNPIGRAFLYAPTDTDDPVPAVAQKLILALPADVRTTAHLDVAVCSALADENGSGTPAGTCRAALLAQTGTGIRPLAGTSLMLIVLGTLIAAAARRSRRSRPALATPTRRARR